MLPLITAIILAANGVVHFLQYLIYFRAGMFSAKYILMFSVMFFFFGFLILGRGMNVIYYMAIFFSLISLFHQAQLQPIKTAKSIHKNLIITLSAASLLALVFGVLLRFVAG